MSQPARTDATVVDGIWAIRFRTPRGEQRSELMLSSTGSGLIGSLDGTAIKDGLVTDGLVTFGAELALPGATWARCAGSVRGDTMTGTATASRLRVRFVGTWVAA